MKRRLELAVLILAALCPLLHAATATVTLNVVPSSPLLGTAVTLIATVTPSAATGKVTFYDGVIVLGTAPISNGQATLTTIPGQTGQRSLFARYSGDAVYTRATSAVVPDGVGATPAFGVSPGREDMSLNVYDFAVGDFNEDGKLDLLAAGSSNTVRVAPGNGDGTFGSVISSILSGDLGITYFAIADFNEDGHVDIAFADGITHSLEVAFGKGDGTFAAATSLSSAYGRVVTADFNKDGHADVAVLHSSTNTVGIILGNGNGTFSTTSEIPFTPNTAFSPLAVGDLNGDGNPDLVAIAPVLPYEGFARNIVTLLGNGDGTFGAPIATSPSPFTNWEWAWPDSFALGDLDGDGKLDLVSALYPDSVEIFSGNGDGTFKPGKGFAGVPNAGPTGILIADFNGDGQPDVLEALHIAYTARGLVHFWPGNSDGTLQPPASYYPDDNLTLLRAGDFNRDGRVDLASVSASDPNAPIVTLQGILAPLMRVSEAHATYFTRGQTGTFTITASNAPGSAATSGTVTVVDSLPLYLTLHSISGDGWSCSGTTCSRSDALSPGASYPPITLIVDVGFDALDLQANTVAVSGGGSVLTTSIVDTVNVLPPVTVTPDTGTGSAQIFKGSYGAAGGYQNLKWVEMLLGVATDGGGQTFCYVHFDVQANTFWLYDDLRGFFVGPVAPGVASNLLQGSLCALSTAESSVTASGSQLTVNASLVFKQALSLNIYLRSYTLQGDTGWVQQGTWTTAAAPLGTMTVSPSSGSVTNGTEQTFTLTYPDTQGFAGAAFGWEQFLVAVASNGGSQPFCYVHYDRGGNGLWMYSSDVGYFLGPVTPGTASNALNSSACSVNTGSATVQNTAGNLVLSVPVTLKGPMVGSQKLFERALTVLNVDTGWVQTGTLTVN